MNILVIGFDDRSYFDGRTTRSIARFSSCLVLLFIPAGEGHAASSRLARQLENRSAWLLPLQWLYKHDLPLTGILGCVQAGFPG